MKLSSRVKILGASLIVISVVSGLHLEKISRVDFDKLFLPKNRVVSDQEGVPLRWFPDSRGERHIWVTLSKISGIAKKAFIAAEDQRFFDHIGIDPVSIVRAFKENMMNGRIVSGASTLTQQMTRIAYPRGRTYGKKFVEMLRSVRAESNLSKEEILEVYLNRVPMGNNLVGVEAASRIYFEKSSNNLSLPEAAMLASLPKAPGTLNPYGKNIERLRERRDWVLDRMHDLDFITLEEMIKAQKKPVQVYDKAFPFQAPHFVDMLDQDSVPDNTVTTIRLGLQNRVEQILNSHSRRLKERRATQGSVVVLENKTSNVLALVGSMEHSKKDLGFNNGATSLRSAGSTLKPFLYAHAIDDGHSPSDTLEDLNQSYISPQGIYRPVNFDRSSYGPVSMREALGNSLNQSAIYMINKIGYDNFFRTVSSLGLSNYPEHDADYYGLGLVVGNLEVKLIQLVAAYAALARGGEYIAPKLKLKEPGSPSKRIFSPEASYIITNILSDSSSRVLTFGDFFNQKLPFKLALKTGTSTNYRDSWIVGYTPEYTIGIWAGNFSGSPTRGLTGAKAGGPILIDILNELYPNSFVAKFKRPEGVVSKMVCSYSGMSPNPSCPNVKEELFVKGLEPQDKCKFHMDNNGLHNLPPRYTDWVYKKFENGGQGKYRLAGYSNNLKNLFNGSKHMNHLESNNAMHITVNSSIKITSPLSGEVYLLNPGMTSHEIQLSASSLTPQKQVSWYVDGLETISTHPPHNATVPLMKGTHQITAIGSDSEGHSISVTIE